MLSVFVLTMTSMMLCFSDINECATNPCSDNCINTPGSFACECEEGFRANGAICEGG